ncbi:MAG TPA: class I SAM-dependent methyltransferase [Stellaceae bacterium]|nr:class I SAM-dependent methyltransferase [Stellaceae bacterium]
MAAASATQLDYGVDAPGVVRGLILGGIAALILASVGAWFHWIWPEIIFGLIGAVLLIESALMMHNAWRGKFLHRDRILNQVPWRGDERVLDVGTGRGLLLIGAAKRLTSGRAVGIDIWSTKDLSGNAIERTAANLAAEGVAARCELATERAQAMNFSDSSFDVVVSNLCLHNIRGADRDRAIAEIARVLKPGGVALISDLMFVRAYVRAFRAAGLSARVDGPYLWDVFPPQNIAIAKKL